MDLHQDPNAGQFAVFEKSSLKDPARTRSLPLYQSRDTFLKTHHTADSILLLCKAFNMSPSALGAKTYSIAAIPADGIGPEVIDAGITALNALTDTLKTFKLEFKNYDWSSETYKKTGKYIPDGGLEELKKHDAIFFGAVGAPGK